MDNPNKKHVDGWFVSSQPHEERYFHEAQYERFPGYPRDAVNNAITRARATIQPSEGRVKLELQVAINLQKQYPNGI